MVFSDPRVVQDARFFACELNDLLGHGRHASIDGQLRTWTSLLLVRMAGRPTRDEIPQPDAIAGGSTFGAKKCGSATNSPTRLREIPNIRATSTEFKQCEPNRLCTTFSATPRPIFPETRPKPTTFHFGTSIG